MNSFSAVMLQPIRQHRGKWARRCGGSLDYLEQMGHVGPASPNFQDYYFIACFKICREELQCCFAFPWQTSSCKVPKTGLRLRLAAGVLDHEVAESWAGHDCKAACDLEAPTSTSRAGGLECLGA